MKLIQSAPSLFRKSISTNFCRFGQPSLIPAAIAPDHSFESYPLDHLEGKTLTLQSNPVSTFKISRKLSEAGFENVIFNLSPIDSSTAKPELVLKMSRHHKDYQNSGAKASMEQAVLEKIHGRYDKIIQGVAKGTFRGYPFTVLEKAPDWFISLEKINWPSDERKRLFYQQLSKYLWQLASQEGIVSPDAFENNILVDHRSVEQGTLDFRLIDWNHAHIHQTNGWVDMIEHLKEEARKDTQQVVVPWMYIEELEKLPLPAVNYH
jgi:hypothetical protein